MEVNMCSILVLVLMAVVCLQLTDAASTACRTSASDPDVKVVPAARGKQEQSKLGGGGDGYKAADQPINCTVPETGVPIETDAHLWKMHVIVACTVTAGVEVFIVVIIVLYWQQIRTTLRKFSCPCAESSGRASSDHEPMQPVGGARPSQSQARRGGNSQSGQRGRGQERDSQSGPRRGGAVQRGWTYLGLMTSQTNAGDSEPGTSQSETELSPYHAHSSQSPFSSSNAIASDPSEPSTSQAHANINQSHSNRRKPRPKSSQSQNGCDQSNQSEQSRSSTDDSGPSTCTPGTCTTVDVHIELDAKHKV